MDARVWHSVPKWGDGPWVAEPDKMQFVDAETGLPCLIVRNNFGALCGYVGVPPGHPAHGLHYDGITQHYDGITQADADERTRAFREQMKAREGDLANWAATPEPTVVLPALRAVSVHGGLTYSGAGHAPTKDAWEKMRGQRRLHCEQAKKYPQGDSAKWLEDWEPVLGDYDAWADLVNATLVNATSVCFVGEGSGDLWIFGFDAAHSGDYCPGLKIGFGGDVYRDIAYMQCECADLARQLAAMAGPP